MDPPENPTAWLREVRCDLAARLNAMSFNGIEVRVRETDPYVTYPRAELIADLFGKADWLGSFKGSIVNTADGAVVSLDDIELKWQARGRNVSRRVLAEVEKTLAEHDVLVYQLHAHHAGAYVWATCGFELPGEDDVERARAARAIIETPAVAEVFNKYRQQCLGSLVIEFMAGFASDAQLDHGDVHQAFQSPGDIVGWAVGESQPLRLGLVKEVLCVSQWKGVKDLRRERSPVVQVSPSPTDGLQPIEDVRQSASAVCGPTVKRSNPRERIRAFMFRVAARASQRKQR